MRAARLLSFIILYCPEADLWGVTKRGRDEILWRMAGRLSEGAVDPSSRQPEVKPEQAQEHFTTAMAIYRELAMTYWPAQAEAEPRELS